MPLRGGRDDADDSSSIRRFLKRADAALEGLAACLREAVATQAEAFIDFIVVAGTRCTTDACRNSPGVGAEGIELAAHRQSERLDPYPSLLTDIFLIDETLKGQANHG